MHLVQSKWLILSKRFNQKIRVLKFETLWFLVFVAIYKNNCHFFLISDIVIYMKVKEFLNLVLRFLTVTVGALLMATNLNALVHAGGLLPGGFTGVTLLIQQCLQKYLNITIPFSLFYWILNLIPALFCFKFVGKRFTLLSIWFIIAAGLFTDIIPAIPVSNDILLCSVFGGMINGFSIFLALIAGGTSGGTDFISIYISEKTGKNSWNIIFAGNCIILGIFGFLFGWNLALYSIILQFASTEVLNTLYKRYKKSTLLIITNHSDAIVNLIKKTTNHDATLFTGIGCFSKHKKDMIYTVISEYEEEMLIKLIKKEDPHAFINVLKSQKLSGNFYIPKND